MIAIIHDNLKLVITIKNMKSKINNMAGKIIKVLAWLAGLQFLFVVFLFLVAKDKPEFHAVMGMAIGLFVFWIILGGFVMKRFRYPIKVVVQKINIDWRIKFILFTTLLALLEEVITTAMTNTAPFYGVTMAAAHITASANYWDVVLTHSVILFSPMFCIWAWLLSKYDFSPNQVFLLWGFSGFFMEVAYGGISHIAEVHWIFVYGLMMYLPAYCIPENRPVKKPAVWLYPLVIFGVPLVGVIPGGILGSIIKHIRPPHYFPGIK